MALIIDRQISSGLHVKNGYLRVEHIIGNKDSLTSVARIYVSQEVADTASPVDEIIFTFTPVNEENSPRWDKQTYEHIKSLDEFADAIDA